MEKKTDLRIKKTYLALEKAFTELLEKKPFESITINELCDAAMIRRTTFYKHFDDKYDYFNFCMANMIQNSKEHVSIELLRKNPVEYTELRLAEHLEFMRTHRKIIQNLKNSNMIAFYYQNLQKQIEDELRDVLMQIGALEASNKTDFTISLYAGAFISAMGWCVDHPDALSAKEIATLIINNLPSPFLIANQ